MQPFDPTSSPSVLKFARQLIWKDVASFLPETYKDSWGKWKLGQLIEKYYFHKPLDNLSEPDFPLAWIELKATPLKRVNKRWVWAKERLVLNIIDYNELVLESWDDSHFLTKNSLLLLIFYLYNEGEIPIHHVIKIVELYSFLDYWEDLLIIKNDWLKIQKKILDWKAHELSEGDTEYLGACTKWSTAEKSYRSQPFSTEQAKQRAFSFKQGYVNFILQKIQGKTDEYDSLFATNQIKKPSIEENLQELFRPYIGKTAFELWELFDMEFKNQKGYYAILSNKILKKILWVKNLDKVEEFEKANIKLKTIRVSQDWSIQEDISFPAFKFTELVKEIWEESELSDMLESTKFLFITYKIKTKTVAEFDRLNDTEKNKFLVLEKIYLWNAPISDIETFAKSTWEETVKRIKEWVIITRKELKNNKYELQNNLPSLSETKMIHVRPHWKNRDDTDILPDWRPLTKQCFWFNKKYIKSQLWL